jgi:HEAT repeat protein
MDAEFGRGIPVESGAPVQAAGPRVGADRPRRPLGAFKCLSLVLVGLLGVLVWQRLWRGSNPADDAIRRFRAGDVQNRIAAVTDLERFGPDEPEIAIAALRSSLEDDDAQVRAGGAVALVMVVRSAGIKGVAQSEVRHAVAALIERRKDPEPIVRASMIQALWLIASLWEGPPGVVDGARVEQELIEATHEPEATVRLSAVRGLGAVGPQLADDPPQALFAALEDPSDTVRAGAADAIVRFPKGLARWLPSVVRSFERADPAVRSGYRLVLQRIRPRTFGPDAVAPLGLILSSPDEEVRCGAASALRSFGKAASPAIPALVASIRRPGREHVSPSRPADGVHPVLTPDQELWWTAGPGSLDGKEPALMAGLALLKIVPDSELTSAAQAIDPQSFATLTAVLGSGTPDVRAVVAYVLGRIEPTPAVMPALGKAVRDPEPTVRAAALKALHDIADRMPFEPPKTFKAALEDASPTVRYWAAGALGHIRLGLDPYIPALLEHAEHDPDQDVRAICAYELQDFVRPSAVTSAVVPVLTRALESPAQTVQSAACGLLAKLGTASAPAIPRLRALAKSSVRTVRESARQALTKLEATE